MSNATNNNAANYVKPVFSNVKNLRILSTKLDVDKFKLKLSGNIIHVLEDTFKDILHLRFTNFIM